MYLSIRHMPWRIKYNFIYANYLLVYCMLDRFRIFWLLYRKSYRKVNRKVTVSYNFLPCQQTYNEYTKVYCILPAQSKCTQRHGHLLTGCVIHFALSGSLRVTAFDEMMITMEYMQL